MAQGLIQSHAHNRQRIESARKQVDDEYKNEPDEGNEVQGEHPNVGYIEQRGQQRHEQTRQEGLPVEHALGKRSVAAACGLSAPLHVIARRVE